MDIIEPKHWHKFAPTVWPTDETPLLEFPFHNWSGMKGTTVKWLDTDSLENWKSNLKITDKAKRLVDLGWTEDSIEYKFNSYGFRCDEFTNEKGAIFLGCSHTGGVGAPNDCVWPVLVAKELGVKCWNLGVGGASIDTCFRLLNYFIDKLNIEYVFLAMPFYVRFDIKFLDTWKSIIPGSSNNMVAYQKIWYSSNQNSIQNYSKTLMAIEYLCKEYELKLIRNSSVRLTLNHMMNKTARDLQHPGNESQESFARLMIDLVDK